ncbi:hypothetical protein I6F15_22850 [Bradyrhizobium sp. BRP14]|nr:hypothetical protein [Bradyrhizobium sp. BRP14]
MAAIADAETGKTDRANGGQLSDDRVCREKFAFGLIFRPVLAKVLRDYTGRLESDKAHGFDGESRPSSVWKGWNVTVRAVSPPLSLA